MFRKSSIIVSLLLLLIFLFSSPVEATPKRIISLSPVGTEILFELGQGDNIAGVTEFCDYPAEALSKPKIGGFSGVNFEAIASSGADFVVISDLHLQYEGDLKKLGVAYAVVRQNSVEDICASITELGRLCSAEAEAARVVGGMKEEIARISSALSGLPPRSVLLCISRELGEPRISTFYAAGKNTFYDELITLAGGVNALTGPSAAYPRISAEGLVSLDPEVVIDLVGDSAYYHSPDNSDSEELFDSGRLRGQWLSAPKVRAVRDGRVSVLRGTVYLRPGPRITEILKAFAAAVHPEADL